MRTGHRFSRRKAPSSTLIFGSGPLAGAGRSNGFGNACPKQGVPVLLSPPEMTLHPDASLAGVLTPLFALRGKEDLGIGDLGALRECLHWAAENGFGVVQLLPVNETGNDNSPYNAISSVALDPATLETHPGALRDLTPEDYSEVMAGVDVAALRKGPVAYAAVKPLKAALLRRAYERFCQTSWRKNDGRARQFRAFMRSEAPWLDGYGLFRVLMEENGGTERWDSWPEQQRTYVLARQWLSSLPAGRRNAIGARVRFAMWVQWVAFGQWKAVRQEADRLGVALMGDIPFGVSYYSADVWAVPEIFNHQWSGGAPPEPLFADDPFTSKWGQNWGVPLYDWEALRKSNFGWWRQRVAKVREIFHLFRIDHILGFYRIYGFPWRPEQNPEFLALTPEEARARTGGELPRFHAVDDDTPEHQARNRAQGEELLRVLVEVCGAYRVIGEDLGTVPPYVRPSLLSLEIAGFRVPAWELEGDGRLIAGAAYDRLSVATFATHDHEPLRVMWERWMGIIRAALDQPEAMGAERDRAWWEVRRLAAWAGIEVPRITPFEEVHLPLLRALFRCNSWIAMTMITDLFGSGQRFNVPGAVSDSNWSSRLAVPVSAWGTDPELKGKVEQASVALAEAGRRHR